MNNYAEKITNECKRKCAIIEKGNKLTLYDLGMLEGYKRIRELVGMSTRTLDRYHLRHLITWANSLFDESCGEYERGIFTAFYTIYDI